MSNYPDGVRTCDIPGWRKEDADWEVWWDSLDEDQVFFDFCQSNRDEIVDFFLDEPTMSMAKFKDLLLYGKSPWNKDWEMYLDDLWEDEND